MMRLSLFCLLMLAAMPCAPIAASADDAATPLEDTRAFEKAYAASFYEFDACGDGLGGRIYRNALSERLKQCPFSDTAKKRFQLRAAAQRKKSSEAMARLIETNGGLPMRLDGMTRSCREQAESPEYRSVRSRIEDYAAGKLKADAVVVQPCDAPDITP